MLSFSVVSAADLNSTDDISAVGIDVEPPSGSIDNVSDRGAFAMSQNDDYALTDENEESYYSGSTYDFILSNNNGPVGNAQVNVKINNEKYSIKSDDSGKVSVPLNLTEGTYEISASYKGVTSSKTVNVLPVVSGKNITKTYGNSKKYTATFLDSNGNPLKSTDVKFILDGKTYTRKTDSNGVASLELNLKVGTYTVYAVHPNGYKISNKLKVKSSVVASDLTKHYLSSKDFSATFYNSNGKVLSNQYVTFKCHGSTFKVKTNSKGVATLSVISKPTSFKMYSINPKTGEQKVNTVKILNTMKTSAMTVFTGRSYTFEVTLYKDEKLVKGSTVYVYIDGVKKALKTDANGVASVSFKLNTPGTYKFKTYDPYTNLYKNTAITVLLASLKAYDMTAPSNTTSVYTVTVLNPDGSLANNAEVQIKLNNVVYNVKSNANGAASISFNLDEGTYKVNCKDLRNNYSLTKTIEVFKSNVGKSYNEYGVSEDGYSILAIGRASSAGEFDKYGYTFYATEFDRTCPYCGSHDLYWSIFFAGSETANWGIFPATGNYEGSSAEGLIVCAKCDSDWSVFGHNHGGTGGDLKVTTQTKSCTKADAYTLKEGNYVVPN